MCFVYFYGKLCYVPCGEVSLYVKDSNMITLYASDTVLLIYIGGGPYRSKGTCCDPNLARVKFSLVLWFKSMPTATKYMVIFKTHSCLNLLHIKFYKKRKKLRAWIPYLLSCLNFKTLKYSGLRNSSFSRMLVFRITTPCSILIIFVLPFL